MNLFENIWTKGYSTELDYHDLKAKFVIQGDAIVGKMHKKILSDEEIEQMNLDFKGESSLTIDTPKNWVELTRKYNRRFFSFGGGLNEGLQQLVELINMPIEDYISYRKEMSDEYHKILYCSPAFWETFESLKNIFGRRDNSEKNLLLD